MIVGTFHAWIRDLLTRAATLRSGRSRAVSSNRSQDLSGDKPLGQIRRTWLLKDIVKLLYRTLGGHLRRPLLIPRRLGNDPSPLDDGMNMVAPGPVTLGHRCPNGFHRVERMSLPTAGQRIV